MIERTLASEKLGKDNVIRLYVPDTGRDKYPVVYFHHGLGFNGLSPWTETGLERIAANHELIIVTADAEDGWFVNDTGGGRMWEDFFVFELPSWVESEFPACPERTARGQAGYSMGGYGAMMLALLHPDRFSAVSTHCGSFLFGHEYRKDRPERKIYMKATAPPGGKYDLYRHVRESLRYHSNPPAIRMDIGKDDYQLEQHRKFHRCLEDNGIAHSCNEYEGHHSWSYVDEHLPESLDFFSKILAAG